MLDRKNLIAGIRKWLFWQYIDKNEAKLAINNYRETFN